MHSVHKSVLLKEIVDSLNLKDESLLIDATFGGGGHSIEILKSYPKAKVIGVDQDAGAWDRAKSKFKNFEDRIMFMNKNFRDLDKSTELTEASVDAIIFDLGFSSDQLDESGRGFSFLRDEPLLMSLKEEITGEDLTAKDIVNDWQEDSIESILRGYGEEKYAKKIAKAIIKARDEKEILKTFDLVDIVKNAVPVSYKKGKIHPATKTFQALRIAVNDELNALKEGLEAGFKLLKSGGRMEVISFHSLEDRIVKNFFRDLKNEKLAILINKKPIVPSAEEIKENRRARSAKLRILEKN